MAISSHIVLSYRDFAGKTGKNANYVGTVTTLVAVDALVAALQAGANAGMSRRSLTIYATETDTPLNADYASVADKAVFEFVCATTGEFVRVAVPSPLKALFDTEKSMEIDPAAALSAAIITQVIAVVTSNSGAAVTSFVKGWREQR